MPGDARLQMTMAGDENNDDKIPLVEKAINGERHHSLPGRLWRLSLAPCIPARYTLAVLSFLGFVNVYALRVNLSVAIVEMVNSTAVAHRGYNAPAFYWSGTITGQVLAAFFYGYLITQIPGGWLAERIGGKWVFGVGIVMTSILTLFTPIAATTSVWLLIAVRVLEGFFEGVTFPAMHSMWGQWAPPAERSILATITYAGYDFRCEEGAWERGPYIGNVISFPVSAVLATYGFDGGWPSVFYVFGIIGIVWFLLWSVLAFNCPAEHPRISDEEREYIESSIAAKRITSEKNLPTPWLAILTSPAVWGVVIAHTSNNWGFYTLLTLMPTYFEQALPNINTGKGIVMSGLFSMIPYILLAILVPISGLLADILRATLLSTTLVRKVFTSVAFMSSATFLLLCGYFGTTTASAVVLLTVAVGMTGVSSAGFSINHLDLSPRYAGVLMGLSNFFATLPGIIGPPIGKAIAKEPSAPKHTIGYLNTYKEEWREVFIVSAEVYIFGTLMYLILGSGRQQWWADGVPRNKNKKKNSSSECKSESCVKETVEAEEHSINADSNVSTSKKSNQNW